MASIMSIFGFSSAISYCQHLEDSPQQGNLVSNRIWRLIPPPAYEVASPPPYSSHPQQLEHGRSQCVFLSFLHFHLGCSWQDSSRWRLLVVVSGLT
ncbi:hypothetical protein GALMADRAFT_1033150 [Galerina marginata CBS 339.88]|uniref:Uncharacterized protein n=1 Tax=Galerina marginata (strain CBS 339.88) TaxID=685588 RepID=A0A067SC59_GALM3|nr:hypothetical protein GALMADRAFT_1033150 [Galerina marginata CBS 339.88]